MAVRRTALQDLRNLLFPLPTEVLDALSGVGENAQRARRRRTWRSRSASCCASTRTARIPTDNPFFATQSGLARAIWAYGLRNPFTFAVQPGTGRIHINDVGQNTWEEINVGAAGANYGWPSSEGPDNVGAGVTAPLFAYKHSDADPLGSGPGGFFTGFAIAGGAFYPATGPFPAGYRDQYYFADFVSKFVGRLDSPTATPRMRSPGSRARRSTCWWASTARSTC